MNATRPRDLLAVALVAALVGNLLIRLSYGSLPGFPLFAGVPLGVLALAEVLVGRSLRARILRRPGTDPVQPLVAARAVLLAKASAVGGSIVAGAWLGLLGHVLPRSAEVSAAASDTAAAVVGLLCASALVAGGLWLEYCCRTPDDPEPGERPMG